MKRILSIFVVMTMILGLLAGCGANTGNDTGSNTNGDEKTPERLTMYIGVVEEQALRIAQEFEKATGIKVDFVRMSGGEILGRVRAEKDNPKASIWYGGPADSFVAAIGITFMHNGLRHIEEGFENIQVVAPEDGTWYSTAAVGIIEGAPELEAAKMFVDWALTKDAQEIGQQFGSYQFPTNPDAKVPEQAKPLADVKLNPYDLEWSGENRAQLVEKWDNMIKDTKKEQ